MGYVIDLAVNKGYIFNTTYPGRSALGRQAAEMRFCHFQGLKNMSESLPRTYVYIDGFNLYYRALKNSQYKWLDLEKLCFSLLAEGTPIGKIKYFTARIKAKTNSFNASDRQGIYLKALESRCGLLERIDGEYYIRQKKRQLRKAIFCKQDSECIAITEKELVHVYEPQEKQTDVNIASHMIHDTWLDLYDQAILITNDTDLATALKFVSIDCPGKPSKRIGLINPSKDGQQAGSLRRYSDWEKSISDFHLKKSQFPDEIAANIRKPEAWFYKNHEEYLASKS